MTRVKFHLTPIDLFNALWFESGAVITIRPGATTISFDGEVTHDVALRYSADEPLPPMGIAFRGSIFVRELSDKKQGRRLLVKRISTGEVFIIAFRNDYWLMARVSHDGTIPSDIDQIAPPRSRPRRHAARNHMATTTNGSALDPKWRIVPDGEYVFRGPYAGYGIVILFGSNLRHCSGKSWSIRDDSPIDFSASHYTFHKPAGQHPLVVTNKNGGPKLAFRIQNHQLLTAELQDG